MENIIFKTEIFWLIKISLITISAFLSIFIANKLIDRIRLKLIKKKKKKLNLIAVNLLKKPIKFLIITLSLSLIIFISDKYLFNYSSIIASKISTLAIFSSFTWYFWLFIHKYEINLPIDSKKIDITTRSAIAKLLKAIVIIIFSLVILHESGVSMGAIVAFGGVGGIAIGFAAKDLLANFFGAVMLHLDRPFSVGDCINSPDRDIQGIVTNIGWRLTKIRMFSTRMLYVPNSIFSNIAIENISRMSNRRIYENIGVRYDDINKLHKIIPEIIQMLKDHKEIDKKDLGKDITLFVNLNKFSDFSADFILYCFTKTKKWEKYHEIKQDILIKVNEIIENNGAQIAFPTSEMKILPSSMISVKNK